MGLHSVRGSRAHVCVQQIKHNNGIRRQEKYQQKNSAWARMEENDVPNKEPN